jgi:hypothetical protein
MSFRHIDNVYWHPLEDPVLQSVNLALAYHAHKVTGQCHPGLTLLCKETGLSRSTMIRAIPKLKDRGRIEVKPYAGRHHQHLYTVSLVNCVTGTPCHWCTRTVSLGHQNSVTVTPKPLKDPKGTSNTPLPPKGGVSGVGTSRGKDSDAGPKRVSGSAGKSETESTLRRTQKPSARQSKPGAYKNDPRFMAFWAAYPNKNSGPTPAHEAWRRIAGLSDELASTIMAQLARAKETIQWTKDGGLFIPMATTWLNQRRWEADYSAPSKPMRVAL